MPHCNHNKTARNRHSLLIDPQFRMHPGQLDVALLGLPLSGARQILAIPLNTFTLSGGEQARCLCGRDRGFRSQFNVNLEVRKKSKSRQQTVLMVRIMLHSVAKPVKLIKFGLLIRFSMLVYYVQRPVATKLEPERTIFRFLRRSEELCTIFINKPCLF